MKSGFININKAPDMTSHDVVNIARRILNTKKVGHAGTLDPFATGVLPIAVGRATKFIEYLSDCDKSYRAEILFGIETTTGDITGAIIREDNSKSFLDVDEVLKSFIGKINQTPPKYSAIKINGRKAYELARKNIDFTIPTREVTIYNINKVAETENTLTVDIDCSKGTYIRSLAVDIGKKFDIPATLKNLQRTRVGNFDISDSITIDELKNLKEIPIVEVENCVKHLPKINLPEWRLKAFYTGLTTRINENFDEGTIFRVYCSNDFIGTGKIVDGELKADKILTP